jgi:hypothetical protein
MPLTLRRTGLSHDPNSNDWWVYEDGEEIGRIYEATSVDADVRWLWAHWLLGPAREANLLTHGRAPTLEDAKAEFRTAIERFRRWRPKDSESPARLTYMVNDRQHAFADVRTIFV